MVTSFRPIPGEITGGSIAGVGDRRRDDHPDDVVERQPDGSGGQVLVTETCAQPRSFASWRQSAMSAVAFLIYFVRMTI